MQVKLEEQTKKIEDLEETVHGAQTEVKRLEMELDSAIREKVGTRAAVRPKDKQEQHMKEQSCLECQSHRTSFLGI